MPPTPASLLDGTPLPSDAAPFVARGIGGAVHARIRKTPDTPPATACGTGLGEWWTGVADEVTCRACRAWLEQRTTSA